MRYFTFGGVDSRTHFLTNYIKRPFLPPITVPTMEIPRKAGVIPLQRNEIGVREITIGVTMMAVSHVDIRQRVRALSAFLVKETEQDLIISDEIDKKYLARFNGSGNDLEELAYTGEGELTFTCFDPFAYALTELTQLSTNQETIITNAGTVEAYPRFRLVTSVNVPFILIKNATTGKSLTYNATWFASTPLIIDAKTNRVYQENTGENFIKYLTLASDFFPLAIGANTLRMETEATGAINQISSFRTYWTERYY
jgi:predicted phage tail component-like protein